jgi:hypothetical protein
LIFMRPLLARSLALPKWMIKQNSILFSTGTGIYQCAKFVMVLD